MSFIANKLGLKQIYGVNADENTWSKAKEKGIIVFKLDISNEKLNIQWSGSAKIDIVLIG